MIKNARIILTLAAISLYAGVTAQDQFKSLIVTNVTPELSVYPCGDRHEALVILRCQEPFDLVLSSNYDATLDLSITTEGPEKVYSIVFKTKEEGTSFKGRQLSVSAEGFKKHYIPLNLNDKEKLEFMVSDPYSKLRSLFYTSTEEGVSFMTDGFYDAAIDKFNVARQCPEYAETENHLDDYIQKCDSLKAWTAQASSYMDNEDYYHARLVYMKMMTENPSSTLIRELYYNANENFNRVSKHDIEVAQAYFDTKRYDEARTLYEHALAQNNPQSSLAGSNLAFIQLKRFKQDNHTRSISYVYDPDCNIGLLSAVLNPDKTSSYFSLGFNMGCIDILTKNIDPAVADPVTGKIIVPDKPMYQAYAGIGWTMRLYTSNKNEWIPKIWVLMSPFSYAGGGFYSKTENPDYNPNSSVSNEKDEFLESYHWMHTLAPEIGAAVRVWRVVMSYRYQYRVVINRESPASDNLGMARNLIGLGFCW